MFSIDTDEKVLFGLTPAETREFQVLSEQSCRDDEFEARTRDARWIELLLKHKTAKSAGCGDQTLSPRN
jgi:hypothetical protein